MDIFERYYLNNDGLIPDGFTSDIDFVVVIPVYDDPDVFMTLDSLSGNENKGMAIFTVVNYGKECDEETKMRCQDLYRRLKSYSKTSTIPLFVIKAFDIEKASVGYARKVGMDIAAYAFHSFGRDDAPIASLDADTLVRSDYKSAICRCFKERSVSGVSIRYEHRLNGVAEEQRCAMLKYELYLRYFRQALIYCNHPYYYTCIGSAFAVRARDYVAVGGMNKRQAGEDFYFIQKLCEYGNFSELEDTCVYQDSRLSFRTPFGTGKSLSTIMQNNGQYCVYSFEAFKLLRVFFNDVVNMKLDVVKHVDTYNDSFRDFLQDVDFKSIMNDVANNTASDIQFRRRFFHRFNTFQVIKCLNYLSQNDFPKEDVEVATKKMLVACDYRTANAFSLNDLLVYMRCFS